MKYAVYFIAFLVFAIVVGCAAQLIGKTLERATAHHAQSDEQL